LVNWLDVFFTTFKLLVGELDAKNQLAIYIEKNGKVAQKKPICIKFVIAQHDFEIETLEGKLKAKKGNYIIMGINGEVYPCKPDIFSKTYEVLEK
jgi:hypothetical protein